GMPTSNGCFPAQAISGSGTRRVASACEFFTGTGTRSDQFPGVTTSGIFYGPPTTAPSGFGNPRRHSAFRCSKDTRSALAMLFGTADLSFRATPAVGSDGRTLTKYDTSLGVNSDGRRVTWMGNARRSSVIP